MESSRSWVEGQEENMEGRRLLQLPRSCKVWDMWQYGKDYIQKSAFPDVLRWH